MAKRKGNWDSNKKARFLREGRGNIDDEGKDYKPWITVQDFSSLGLSTRLTGIKTEGRMHTYFSDLQRYYHYLLEFDDEVIDIREHFPLLDLDETLIDLKVAKEKKFIGNGVAEPYVLTTTFLVTTIDSYGQKRLMARTVKSSSEAKKDRSLKRLAIEQQYWNQKSINWGIVTEKEINKAKARNIEWILTAHKISDLFNLDEENEGFLLDQLASSFEDTGSPLGEFLEVFDYEYGLPDGCAVVLFKNLLFTKSIRVDLEQPIDFCAEIMLLKENEGGISDGILNRTNNLLQGRNENI